MTYSRALPDAMGYTVTMDDSAGYGVTRMIVSGGDRPLYKAVWNPRDDSAQCFEVLCWLMKQKCFRSIGCKNVNTMERQMTQIDADGRHALRPSIHAIPHDNTPASLRAAIVEAAERVADAKGDK